MSVAFDAVSATDFAAASSASWTHTPAGTPTAVGVGVASAVVAGDASISSITYGAGSLTQACTVAWTQTHPNRSSLWGLASPASGAQTVAVTFNGAVANYGAAGAITVTGSDASTCFSNTNTGQGDGAASSTCTSVTGELVMDNVFSAEYVTNGNGPTVSGSNTQRWSNQNIGAGQTGGGSTIAGASSVTMSWSRNAPTTEDGWGQCLGSFQAAAGGQILPFPWMHNSGGMMELTGGMRN